MLDHAREAVELAGGKTVEDLRQTRILQLALVRLVEVIGEAASKIPPETRSTMPAIPWTEVVGIRNRLIHGYDKIDFNILWRTIQLNLPALITELNKELTLRGDRQP